MPGAPPPSVLDEVHSSCAHVVAASGSVALDAAAIAAYASSLDAAAVVAAGRRSAAFPIAFDSVEAEVTFMALYHLLDFGSGYDTALRAATGRGARETLQYGCFSLALSAARLDGPWMRAFSPYAIFSAFGIEAKVEQQLQPGISISKPGPLAPLVAALHSAVVQAGESLAAAGQRSLGALILGHLSEQQRSSKPISAASLVAELAEVIPGFQDGSLFVPPAAAPSTAAAGEAEAAAAAADAGAAAEAAGSAAGGAAIRVTFLRKAQGLAAELAARFGGEDARFAWSDAASLAADSGALLPAVLRQLGLLRLSPALAAALDAGEPLPQGSDERALRAGAVAAVDAVVAAAAAAGGAAAAGSDGGSSGGGGSFTARDLSCYLLLLVEEGEGRRPARLAGQELRPHCTTGTAAY